MAEEMDTGEGDGGGAVLKCAFCNGHAVSPTQVSSEISRGLLYY